MPNFDNIVDRIGDVVLFVTATAVSITMIALCAIMILALILS